MGVGLQCTDGIPPPSAREACGHGLHLYGCGCPEHGERHAPQHRTKACGSCLLLHARPASRPPRHRGRRCAGCPAEFITCTGGRGSPFVALRNFSFIAAAWSSRARRLMRARPRAALIRTGTACGARPRTPRQGSQSGAGVTAAVTCIASLQDGDVPADAVQAAGCITSRVTISWVEVPVSRQPPAARARARPGLAVGWAASGPHKPLISFMIIKLLSFIRPLMGRDWVESSILTWGRAVRYARGRRAGRWPAPKGAASCFL